MAIGSNRFVVMAGDVVRLKSGGAVMTADPIFDLTALDRVNAEDPVTNAL